MDSIKEVRAAVADALATRGIGQPSWRQDIREGRRDDTPFMIGAPAIAERVSTQAK